jgi:hypothetical protein
MQPWQVFHSARKYIGVENVARIFNKEKRSAYNWGQDPAYTEHRCKNPLELLHALFVKMDDVGIGYVASAALRYLETAIEQDVDRIEIHETKPTINEEILADYGAVAALQRAIDAGEPLETIKSMAVDAIGEIQRTVAKVSMEGQR